MNTMAHYRTLLFPHLGLLDPRLNFDVYVHQSVRPKLVENLVNAMSALFLVKKRLNHNNSVSDSRADRQVASDDYHACSIWIVEFDCATLSINEWFVLKGLLLTPRCSFYILIRYCFFFYDLHSIRDACAVHVYLQSGQMCLWVWLDIVFCTSVAVHCCLYFSEI